MLSTLCGCFQASSSSEAEAAGEKGDPAYGQAGTTGSGDKEEGDEGKAGPPPQSNGHAGSAQNNGQHEGDDMSLLSIRARRRLIRDAGPAAEEPTRFLDDVEEEASEDEDGDEVAAVAAGKFCGQDYQRLKAACLSSGKLFVDPEFPPGPSSLYGGHAGQRDASLEWRRASQLVDEPHLFVEGASRFDVKQGELGDCWLLAAIANLTMKPHLYRLVVPRDQSFSEDYAGIFHFR